MSLMSGNLFRFFVIVQCIIAICHKVMHCILSCTCFILLFVMYGLILDLLSLAKCKMWSFNLHSTLIIMVMNVMWTVLTSLECWFTHDCLICEFFSVTDSKPLDWLDQTTVHRANAQRSATDVYYLMTDCFCSVT